jgi:hypothetical protein
MTGFASMVQAFGQSYDVPNQHEGVAQHHLRYEAIAKLCIRSMLRSQSG